MAPTRRSSSRIRPNIPAALAHDAIASSSDGCYPHDLIFRSRSDGEVMSHKIHIEFPGRIVFIGFGSIGQGTLPLILRHIGIPKERITIITADDLGKKVAAEYGIKLVQVALTRDNYRRELDQYIGRGDFVLNVSVDVSSIALVKYCWSKGAMYLD